MRDARVKRLLWVLERSGESSPATPATPANALQDTTPERGRWEAHPPQTPAHPPRVLNGTRTPFAGDAGDAGGVAPPLSKTARGEEEDEVEVEL